MERRAYDKTRSKSLRRIDQKRILDKVAELEVSIGKPTTAREIASALNRDNLELAASSPGPSRGITGMRGRAPTFYTTKLVAADLSVLRRQGLVSREIDHKVGSAVYGRTDKAYSRKTGGKFEPHMMFNPETGEGFFAEKEEDHIRMDAMGFTHVKPKSYMSHGEKNCGCGMDPCRTYGYESPGFKELKEQNAGKWSVNDWEKFDDEFDELSNRVDVKLLDEIDDKREFRMWKEVNDLRLIQKELETASKTHKSQSELLKAMNRPYDRRNSAMFTRSTGTFRQFGGKRFILDDVYGTKDQARYMAGYWRARGMNARVIPVKNGSAIYIRKKGKVQPGISSRRRGK